MSGTALLFANPALHMQVYPLKTRFYNAVLQDLHYVSFGPSQVKHLLWHNEHELLFR